MARELDDAILTLRTNELELGLWLFKTTGDPHAVVDVDRFILEHQDNWFVREVLGMMRRTFARLDVSSRSMFTFVTPGSCFAGALLELALASDRVYMLQTEEGEPAASLLLSPMNFGPLPMVNDRSRLAARFYGDAALLDALHEEIGVEFTPAEAVALGLVTDAPDALDWDDELRQAIESRVALSPDALTGMEANLRFPLPETQATRIFGRLSAWQNWIFIRPNATGDKGALKVYGSGAQPKFDWDRI
jgi:benzoyl-CoA-dihydrodiol lyase